MGLVPQVPFRRRSSPFPLGLPLFRMLASPSVAISHLTTLLEYLRFVTTTPSVFVSFLFLFSLALFHTSKNDGCPDDDNVLIECSFVVTLSCPLSLSSVLFPDPTRYERLLISTYPPTTTFDKYRTATTATDRYQPNEYHLWVS